MVSFQKTFYCQKIAESPEYIWGPEFVHVKKLTLKQKVLGNSRAHITLSQQFDLGP